WSSYATYVAGDVVSYDGVVYEAKWWTRSFAPDTSVINSWGTPWKELSF
ncbi:carbohydrate-binding protein, partial [bacterium]|nr:carbohydrate-binding protein [bacterium]